MQIHRSGIILNTEHYEACVAFYRDLLGLPVLFVKHDADSHLTCLDLGGCYLMIEAGGQAKPGGRSVAESPHKLRFNVQDLEAAQRSLRDGGLAAEIQSFSWGRVINVHDPDGNRVGIRDEAQFLNPALAECVQQGEAVPRQ